ncbi:MAG: L-fucose/L-arabinose isomerase family protein [Ilumatobacteraceae bacterium]
MITGFDPIKPPKRARIGLYSAGLHAYWDQFPGLRDRLTDYGSFIEQRLSVWGDVHNFGLVDTEGSGREAGEWLQSRNVDIVFCHSATYSTASTVLPIHQLCNAPVVVLNLQPAARLDYDRTTTGEWLAHCGACPVPEYSNAFERARIPFRVVNGLLGLESTPAISLTNEITSARPEAVRAWGEIEAWARAAGVARTFKHSRFGFLGNTYGGMLDLYSDLTMVQAQTGLHVEVLEIGDLQRLVDEVTAADIAVKRSEVAAMFDISEDSPSDPIARRPTDEQMEWSCRVAAAQERLVREFDLDALVYYYHGAPDSAEERLQAGFIVGHSLLTARGVPCAGEGDLKTAIAMKISDTLGVGGSFTEIVVVDYDDETIILGHDGPFHMAIAEGRPVLRGLGLYHGKQGTGVSVEAKVRTGAVTTLNVTQTADGRLKLISSEGTSTDGPTMKIGNTQTPVRFSRQPDAYMSHWFAHAPTHHCAMSVGHNAGQFAKVAEMMNLEHRSL